jgi:hypothetical protein
MPFHLTVVTPEGEAFDKSVESVVLPGAEGEFGVLPGHEPFMTGLLDEKKNEFHGRPTYVMQMPDGALLVSDEQNGATYRISYDGKKSACRYATTLCFDCDIGGRRRLRWRPPFIGRLPHRRRRRRSPSAWPSAAVATARTAIHAWRTFHRSPASRRFSS